MSAGIHEELARHRKAVALAQVLRQAGCDKDAAMHLHPSDWIKAAKQAGVNPPSTLTVLLVAEMLDEERPDPFAKLEASYEADLVRSA
jgi:hypothetical protein